MSAHSPRAGRDDWLWDLAHVCAAPLRTWPKLTWCGLAVALAVAASAGSSVGLPYAVVVGLLAGGLIRRRMPAALWLALAIPPLVVALMPLQIWLPAFPSWIAWPDGRALGAATGALAGFVVTQRAHELRRAPLVACLLAGAFAFAVFGRDEPPLISKSGIGAAAALLTALMCLAALALRGRWAWAWGALAVFSGMTALTWASYHGVGTVGGGALLVPWAARTGRVLLDSAATAPTNAPATRLVVRLQTRVWKSAFLVLAGSSLLSWSLHALFEQAWHSVSYYVLHGSASYVVFLGPGPMTLALLLLFHAGWASDRFHDRLAVWVAAAVVTPLLNVPDTVKAVVVQGVALSDAMQWSDARTWSVVLLAGLAFGRRVRDEGPGVVGALLVVVMVLAAPAITFLSALSGEGWLSTVWLHAWAPLAHWLIVRRTSTRVLLSLVLTGGALHVLVMGWDRSIHGALPSALATPALWLIAAAVIVAARRVRAMTAVPEEHPVVADWGIRP